MRPAAKRTRTRPAESVSRAEEPAFGTGVAPGHYGKTAGREVESAGRFISSGEGGK
jgi:hypothetical protein